MTREEILNLSKMSEEEQDAWLDKHGLLELTTQDLATYYRESKADLADRLFRDIKIGVDVHHLYAVYVQLFEVELINDSDCVNFYRWWALDSLPIHRIQAALLAKEGK